MPFLPKKRPRKPRVPEEKLKVRVVYRPPKVPAEFPSPKKAQPPAEAGPRVPAEGVKEAPAKAPEVVGETKRKFRPINIILPVIIIIIIPIIAFVIYPNFLAETQEEQVTASVKIESATFILTGINYEFMLPEGYFEFSGTATLPFSPSDWETAGKALLSFGFGAVDIEGGIGSIFSEIQSCPWDMYPLAFCRSECYRGPGQPASGKWTVVVWRFPYQITQENFSPEKAHTTFLPGTYALYARIWYKESFVPKAEDKILVTVLGV